ncbi:MAG: PASTA domain-containing protein [Prevotellaceae bacterium]|jgi:cell division protein FtsI (penicillin-binding protein 3)|nr:PASTA domain-containing protein [Prevotellaceae bacterium]
MKAKKVTNRVYKSTRIIYGCFIGFAAYCVGWAISDLLDTELREAEKKARQRIVNEGNFRRGNILSSDEKPLAAYLPEYVLLTDFGIRISENFTIDRRKVVTDKNAAIQVKLDTFRINVYRAFSKSLSKAVGGTADDYYRELYNYRIRAENSEVGSTENILKRRISISQRDEILNNPYLKKRGRNKTGIYATETGARLYPFGKSFARSVIGVVSESQSSGIEGLYDRELKKGDDIITTIDTRMQDICEAVLRREISADERLAGGTIILMEVATGDIKAMANLGMYSSGDRHADVSDIYNNALRAAIEPGSTFKTVSLLLAMETGKIRLTDKFNTKVWRKSFFEENKLDSFLSVSKIIERSSNTGTANMIDRAFDGNVENFIKAVKSLKITDSIGNLGETLPFINTKLGKESMMRLSHGYQLRMAPIHILSFYNAIANNGVLVQPRIVRGLRHSRGGEDIFKPKIISKSICSKTTLDSVRTVLSRVVGQGSAQQIAGSPYGISGKTGTALIYQENEQSYRTKTGLSRELSSFCGYFPEKNPKYSCIVVLYSRFLNSTETEKFSASSTAVPVFRRVSDKIYSLYIGKPFTPAVTKVNIPVVKNTRGDNLSIIAERLDLQVAVDDNGWIRVDTADKKLQVSKISVKRGIIPNVVGMGLRDALFLMENRGLKVSYSGIGTVVKQSPEHGVSYNSGQKIHLTLSPD